MNLHYPELIIVPSVADSKISASGLSLSNRIGRKELAQAKARDQLLPGQVQRLLMCLDVYLETDTPASSAVPLEIPQEKMMPRTSR